MLVRRQWRKNLLVFTHRCFNTIIGVGLINLNLNMSWKNLTVFKIL